MWRFRGSPYYLDRQAPDGLGIILKFSPILCPAQSGAVSVSRPLGRNFPNATHRCPEEKTVRRVLLARSSCGRSRGRSNSASTSFKSSTCWPGRRRDACRRHGRHSDFPHPANFRALTDLDTSLPLSPRRRNGRRCRRRRRDSPFRVPRRRKCPTQIPMSFRRGRHSPSFSPGSLRAA